MAAERGQLEGARQSFQRLSQGELRDLAQEWLGVSQPAYRLRREMAEKGGEFSSRWMASQGPVTLRDLEAKEADCTDRALGHLIIVTDEMFGSCDNGWAEDIRKGYALMRTRTATLLLGVVAGLARDDDLRGVFDSYKQLMERNGRTVTSDEEDFVEKLMVRGPVVAPGGNTREVLRQEVVSTREEATATRRAREVLSEEQRRSTQVVPPEPVRPETKEEARKNGLYRLGETLDPRRIYHYYIKGETWQGDRWVKAGVMRMGEGARDVKDVTVGLTRKAFLALLAVGIPTGVFALKHWKETGVQIDNSMIAYVNYLSLGEESRIDISTIFGALGRGMDVDDKNSWGDWGATSFGTNALGFGSVLNEALTYSGRTELLKKYPQSNAFVVFANSKADANGNINDSIISEWLKSKGATDRELAITRELRKVYSGEGGELSKALRGELDH